MRRSQPYARETGVAATSSCPQRDVLDPALLLRAILDRIKADFIIPPSGRGWEPTIACMCPPYLARAWLAWLPKSKAALSHDAPRIGILYHHWPPVVVKEARV